MKLKKSPSKKIPLKCIKPGQIWKISNSLESPLEFNKEEKKSLYSDTALKFFEEDNKQHYVMIVHEPETEIETDSEWHIVNVMLISSETEYVNYFDVLIPDLISGMGKDLLAETWHILPMLTCNLLTPVGKQLSREIYDALLDVNDYYNDVIEKLPIKKLKLLGLETKEISVTRYPKIKSFQQRESDWVDILKIPVAAYRTYSKKLKVANALLKFTLETEREVQQILEGNLITKLSKWLIDKKINFEWKPLDLSLGMQTPVPVIVRQKKSLVDLIQTSTDDLIIWQAANQLWKEDPNNPFAGVRKIKQLESKVVNQPLVLMVGILKRVDKKYSILLRVYPLKEDALLPNNLRIIVLEENDEEFDEAQATSKDKAIQIIFSGSSEESFSIKLALNNEQFFTENFVI
jgi:hypothetical protein